MGRVPYRLAPDASAPVGSPAVSILEGLDGSVLEDYDDVSLVEIKEDVGEELRRRGDEQSVYVTLRDDLDNIYLNGRVLDARDDKSEPPPGETYDPPYASNEQGSWLIQFIGPIKPEWMEAVKAEGVVAVQYLSMDAYIVGARESAIQSIDKLPFVQWTLQMHRFLKPSIGKRDEETIELWIELAETEMTDDAVAVLDQMSEKGIESARWSESERRVQGIFRVADVDTILAQPLVIGIAERPTIGLSDERAVLGLTDLVPSVGSPAPEAGKYKKWLSDLCPSCTNLQGDGFYVGIADTGLDGGDRVAGGSLSGEAGSTNLHQAEIAAGRVAWGQSFESNTGDWSQCASRQICPDSTNSKHDVLGHGTLVAGIAAGDPPVSGGKDSDGFFWGLGVAPSAGLVITKINSTDLGTGATPLSLVTQDARTQVSPHAYWQNFSLNQYYGSLQEQEPTFCDRHYDGAYSMLSREFDTRVRDADIQMAGDQQLTITTSSGNTHQQSSANGWNPSQCTYDFTLTLPPATAKNVIAFGGAENVRPDPWLCFGSRADSYTNLAMDAKHGTRIAGWYKPDLIAVTSNITSILSNDKAIPGGYCSPNSGIEPSVPSPYLPSTGTSFAAPAGLGAAVLASRRYHPTAGQATPALVKAMLIAGAKSMLGGKDRATLRTWKSSFSAGGYSYYVGNRALPTVPNSHYYEVEAVGSSGYGRTGSGEPIWPVDDTTVFDGSVPSTRITWRDKGVEDASLAIGGFPNDKQGFGRLSLEDVLSDYPMRAFVNEDVAALQPGSSWINEYMVHDLSLPVRIALVWTDRPAMWSGSNLLPGPPLVNDLDLSIEVRQGVNCVGRYLGNALSPTTEESTFYQPCSGGTADTLNNVEIARFFASPGQGNTTFTVKVASSTGSAEAQNFALVVWNAYDSDTGSPPPSTPANFTATATSTSQVSVTWTAASGATSYELQRSAGASDPYVTIATPSGTSFADSGRSANTTYLYRVRARNGTGKSDWSVDPATTVLFTDPTLTGGSTLVKAVHVADLRQAVTAMRNAAELGAFAWNDDPLVAGTTPIRAIHVGQLRTALQEARSALGLATLVFTDGTLVPQGSVVKKVHVQELRDGVK